MNLNPAQYLKTIFHATQVIVRGKKYLALALILGFAFFGLVMFYQSQTTPWLSLPEFILHTKTPELLYTLILSLATGLSLSMLIFSFTLNKKSAVKGTGNTVLGLLSSFASIVFASATCAACLGVLVSLMGSSTLIFLVRHRLEFMLLSLLLVVFSLYQASKKTLGLCKECGISQ